MESGTFPEMTLESGVEMEERCFLWKVKNFKDFQQNVGMGMMCEQKLDFFAGDSLSCSSKYSMFLQHRNEPDTDPPILQSKEIAFCVMLKEASARLSQYLFSQWIFTLKDQEGAVYFRTETNISGLCSVNRGPWRANEFLEPDWEVPLDQEGSLLIHVTFKLRLNAPLWPTKAVGTALERFHFKSTAKARRELAELLETAGASQNIRIVSNDGNEFRVPKGVLVARSQVFKAMLETDMVEGNTGVIHIQDMGSKSLKVLLNYLYTGELHPDWRESKVLVEFTNSVAKYQLPDLLHFLDGVVGKVCDLDNVGALSGLAHGLSMETAEKELLSFIRKNGTSSMESLFRMLKGVTSLEEAEEETPTTFPNNAELKSMDSGVASSEISSTETLTISDDNNDYDNDNVSKNKMRHSSLWCLCWRPKISRKYV